MPPETREWMEMVATRSTSYLAWVAGFFLQLCIGMIFAPIGGMLGALFFKKDLPPALGGGPPPLP
jgi:uncharacterized protein involved in cysteine biosynthesis